MADIWMDVDAALSEVPVNIFPLIDDTDFKTRETGIVYNQAGMDLVWNFVTTAGVMTQTAVTPTTAGDYDWTNQGDGMYSIEIPASGGASINNDTEGFGWFTGICTGVLAWRGPIIGFRDSDLNDKLIDSAWSATRGLAGTALPDAAADAAGGLPISDAGGLNLDGRLDAAVSSRAVAGDNMNLADNAITAAKYDESTAFPVKSDDSGSTQIARTGADGDTLETISDQIDGVSTLSKADVAASLVDQNISELARQGSEVDGSLYNQLFPIIKRDIEEAVTLTSGFYTNTSGERLGYIENGAEVGVMFTYLSGGAADDPDDRPGEEFLGAMMTYDADVDPDGAFFQIIGGYYVDTIGDIDAIGISRQFGVCEGFRNEDAFIDDSEVKPGNWNGGAAGDDSRLYKGWTFVVKHTEDVGGSTIIVPHSGSDMIIRSASGISIGSGYKFNILSRYADGFIYYHASASNTNTALGVDGTIDNPVSDEAAALNLAEQLASSISSGAKKFKILNGAFIMPEAINGAVFEGEQLTENCSITFNSLTCGQNIFKHLRINDGTLAGTYNEYYNCELPDGSNRNFGLAIRCKLLGTFEVGSTELINCYGDAVTFKRTDGDATDKNIWNFNCESLTLDSFTVAQDMTIGLVGNPDVTVNANCTAGSVTIMGFANSLTDNSAGTTVTDQTNMNYNGKSAEDISDVVWDELLTGATHNIATSAGRRLRALQDFGNYSGYIWIDTVDGVAGTVDYENGTEDNPVDTLADALTLSASLNIKRFRVAPGSSITLAGAVAGKTFEGDNWTLALGGVSIANSHFSGATVSGTGTGSGYDFHDCTMGICTIADGDMIGCAIADDITLSAAGDYFWDQCFSGVAGNATPSVDFGALVGNTNLNMRHYSGGIEVENMGGAGTDNMSLEGQGQLIINANCSGGTIAIRGNFGPITDNASEAVSLTETGNISSVQGKSYAAGTFDRTTDALEAIRDRGDAAWTSDSDKDWTANEKTEIKTVLGITDTGTPDSTPSDGALKNIQDNIGTPVDLGDGAALGEMLTAIAGKTPDAGSYARANDSLEAIRDRGDAAWSSAAGHPDVLEETTIATLASQVSFTLTAGSSDDDAYNGAMAVITDAVTAEQKAVADISDYTGSTKTVTLLADPAIFTMAVGDSIAIVAKKGAVNANIKYVNDAATNDGVDWDVSLKKMQSILFGKVVRTGDNYAYRDQGDANTLVDYDVAAGGRTIN